MPAPRTNVFDRLAAVLERLRHPSRLQFGVGAGVVALAVVCVVGGVVVAGRKVSRAAAVKTHPHGVKLTRKTVKRRVAVRALRCPLTDVPTRVVAQRPALLVKVGNEPGPSRPQSGLDEADVVFDTPAEGFVMRYIAVYQCGPSARIGPMRSVRWVDYHLAPEFGQPILAFAGGIDPNLQAVAGVPGLTGANVLAGAAGAGYRTTDRQPPDNLYTSTAALYGLYPGRTRAPKPIFAFTPLLPAGSAPLATAELDFSGGTDVVWKWQPSCRCWLHTYSGVPDVDALSNQPVTATNIVVEIVPYTIGPYAEGRVVGTGDVQSETFGSGRGWVLRDGRAIGVIWQRATAEAPTTFTAANGRSVGLAAGRTWVELITTTQAAGGIHFTP